MGAWQNSKKAGVAAIEIWKQRRLIWRLWRSRKVLREYSDEQFLRRWDQFKEVPERDSLNPFGLSGHDFYIMNKYIKDPED